MAAWRLMGTVPTSSENTRIRAKLFRVLVMAACGLWLTEAGAAVSMQVRARSAILVDLTDGQVLFEQNADVPIAPASLTKVLTLYVVHEAIEQGRLSPWEKVRVSREAASTGGSRMGLRAGDLVSVEELIKGMAVVSGNDACVAVAEHLAGSADQFMRLMNRKAAELGMRHSHFVNPSGLPAKGQYTTARDMALLSAAYLRRFPHTLPIHSMQAYTYARSTHRNANRLLGTCPGVDGLKTGFVCSSGYNITATALRDGRRLVAVVLGARTPGERAAETAKLLNAGYASLGIVSPTHDAAADTRAASRRTRTARKGSTPPLKTTSAKPAPVAVLGPPKASGARRLQNTRKSSPVQIAKVKSQSSRTIRGPQQIRTFASKTSPKEKGSSKSTALVTAGSSHKERKVATRSPSKAVKSASASSTAQKERKNVQSDPVSSKRTVTAASKGSPKELKTVGPSGATATPGATKKNPKAPLSAAKTAPSSGAVSGKNSTIPGGKT